MLKIRLQRVGRTNDPSFRVVVTEHTNGPQSGKFLEVLGTYDARRGEPHLDADRITHWLSQGAQASPTVHNLLVRAKVIEGKPLNVSPKPKPKAAPAPEPETPVEAPAPEPEAPAETPAAPTPEA